MLLDRGADCNAQNFAGDTPLHKAAAGDNMTIIEARSRIFGGNGSATDRTAIGIVC